jgi:hypothetical protein
MEVLSPPTKLTLHYPNFWPIQLPLPSEMEIFTKLAEEFKTKKAKDWLTKPLIIETELLCPGSDDISITAEGDYIRSLQSFVFKVGTFFIQGFMFCNYC